MKIWIEVPKISTEIEIPEHIAEMEDSAEKDIMIDKLVHSEISYLVNTGEVQDEL